MSAKHTIAVAAKSDISTAIAGFREAAYTWAIRESVIVLESFADSAQTLHLGFLLHCYRNCLVVHCKVLEHKFASF